MHNYLSTSIYIYLQLYFYIFIYRFVEVFAPFLIARRAPLLGHISLGGFAFLVNLDNTK